MSRRSLEDLKYDLEHTKKENIATNLANYLKLEKLLIGNKITEALEFVREHIEINKKADKK